MLNRGRSYFLDNSLADVTRVSEEIAQINPKLAHELLMDYKEGIMDEAGGLLFNAKRTGPKYTAKGQLRKNSDRIAFSRNSFNDLSTSSKIRVLKDNIDGYNALVKIGGLSNDQLLNKLEPHNPNKLIYDDIKKIYESTVDSKTGVYSGPGQVGSPGRAGGKQFNKAETVENVAQFLTEPPTDRLLGTHVSYAQQGHVLDANNNPLLARKISNMRAQQGEPNRQDGADARGLVNMTREQNLENGRNRDIDRLLEVIDTRLSENVSERETMNLVNLAQELQGTNKRYASEDPLIRAILSNTTGKSTRTDSPGSNRERALNIDMGGGDGDVIIGDGVLRSNGKNGNGNGKH